MLPAPVDVSDAIAAVRIERLQRSARNSALRAPRTLANHEWPPNYDDALLWRRGQLATLETNPHLIPAAKAYYAQDCVSFINHWCDTHDPRNAGTTKPVWMPFILFKRQEELVHFVQDCLETDQPGLVEKCRTMGATWVCVCISVWLWLFYPGVAIGWGSQDADSVDQIGNPKSIFFKIRGLIDRLPEIFKPQGLTDSDIKQYVCYNRATGSSIVGEVGDKIGRGGRTRLFFKDESAHYQRPELIEASLSETTKVPIDISSVNGLGNLFHRKREVGQDWYPGAQIPRGITRIFVMDSHEHPEFGEEWHREKKAYHLSQGTPHIYAQEIERNYAASLTGTILPKEWLDACIDAHLKLGFDVGQNRISGLDIGDSEDGDRNAQVVRSGVVLTFADEWVARDPGVTARKAIANCVAQKVPELQYDAVAIGSNVKSEVNRLKDDNLLPDKLRVVPWNAGGKVLHAAERVNADDRDSVRNKDFFANLKAQAWWALRGRVLRTYQAVVGIPDANGVITKISADPDDIFSIDSRLPLLHKVIKELCQATASTGSRLKLVVDKSPDGTRSPNLADAIVMAYWPMPRASDFVMVGMGPKVFVDGKALK